MPKITISICEQCGNSFTIDLSKCELLPGMHPKIRKQDDLPRPIKTWADWIDHISNNCPNCR